MSCVQNSIFSGICNKLHITNNYPNQSKSQGHVNNVLKDHCTKSTVVETHFIKK